MDIHVNVEQTEQGHSVLEVRGEVDMHTSPRVRDAQIRLLKGTSRRIVVDLSGVAYMDSSGIATLIEGLQWCRREGREFRLVGLTPTVRDVFELARLAEVFEIFSTRDEALKDA